MGILILLRDWINVERKNCERSNLLVQFEYTIDEISVDFSEEDMNALEEQALQSLLEHVTKEMLDDLWQNYFQGYKY